MNSSLTPEIQTLSEIAEMKRIYSAVEPYLLKETASCIVVTSAMQGEGKTSVVAGLSTIAVNSLKKKVLAIDINWGAPVLHKYFGLDLVAFDSFKNGVPIRDMIKSSGVNNFDILTAIQPNSTDDESYLDENTVAAGIVKQARSIYDIIFIDTSAIFPTNRHMMDPVAVAKVSDGVLMVVLANVTPRQQVKRAQTTLDTAGTNIIGVIVNQWKNPIAWTISHNFA